MTDFTKQQLKKLKVMDDVEQAINITQNPNNSNMYMGAYSQIIGCTNENQKAISKIINYKDKNVLVTGSSGDQYLSSVFYGSNKETIYDINSLAEYYIFLKIAAIRNLKYEKFIELMLPFINNNKYFNYDILKYLLSEVEPHIREFWKLCLESIDIKNINNLIVFLDSNVNAVKNRVPYYNEKNYKHLQELLRKKDNPKFIKTDASYFEYSIKDTYDFISLSNIIECSQQPFDDVMDKRLYSHEEWIEYIDTVISKNLNKDGELIILQTSEWNYKPYIDAGYKKYTLSQDNQTQTKHMLVLKK